MKNSKKLRLTVYLLLVAVLLGLLALPVLAGEGDGSGGGQSQPLSLLTSVPADGQQRVPVDTRIKLSFNKNVINMTVKENNLKCFQLLSGGTPVPIKVEMADDQIEPEKKRDVELVPQQKLQAGTIYNVVILPALQAKNGSTLANKIEISFTTAGTIEKADTIKPATPVKDAADAQSTKQTSPQPETSTVQIQQESNIAQDEKQELNSTKPQTAATNESAAVDQKVAGSEEKAPPASSSPAAGEKGNGLGTTAAVLVVAAAVALVYFLRRQK